MHIKTIIRFYSIPTTLVKNTKIDKYWWGLLYIAEDSNSCTTTLENNLAFSSTAKDVSTS